MDLGISSGQTRTDDEFYFGSKGTPENVNRIMVSDDDEGGHKFSASGSRTEHGHVNDALVYRQGNYGCHCGGHSDITSGVSQRSARYITCNTSGRGGGVRMI